MSGPRTLPAKDANAVAAQSPSGHSRTEGVALSDEIEHMGPDMFFVQLRGGPTPHPKRISLRDNSPYESATVDLKSCIYDAIIRFFILAGSYCAD